MNDDKRKLSTPNKRRSLNPRNYQNPVGGSITDPLNVKGDAADEVKGIQKVRKAFHRDNFFIICMNYVFLHFLAPLLYEISNQQQGRS